jgi:hypothetical protein
VQRKRPEAGDGRQLPQSADMVNQIGLSAFIPRAGRKLNIAR